jgi:two-component system phosphate regulon sensor histidine kinase PhoR
VARLQRRLDREHRIRLDAEIAAEKAVARLHEVDRLKTVFLSTVSHELRTPLTSIAGFTSLLLDHADSIGEEERRDMLRRIERNSQVLLTIIEDLLELSTIERGSPRLHLGPVPLERAVADAVVPFAGAEHHDVRAEIAPDVVAVADERALARILANLLANAVQYSPAGTTVTVSASAGGGRCTLLVDDQGPGIPLDERDLVFERFYRGSDPAVATTHGTGIGLSVVRSLAEAMDGSATVLDAPGGGARLAVSLPAHPR